MVHKMNQHVNVEHGKILQENNNMVTEALSVGLFKVLHRRRVLYVPGTRITLSHGRPLQKEVLIPSHVCLHEVQLFVKLSSCPEAFDELSTESSRLIHIY